jgi:hypothetical protein
LIFLFIFQILAVASAARIGYDPGTGPGTARNRLTRNQYRYLTVFIMTFTIPVWSDRFSFSVGLGTRSRLELFPVAVIVERPQKIQYITLRMQLIFCLSTCCERMENVKKQSNANEYYYCLIILWFFDKNPNIIRPCFLSTLPTLKIEINHLITRIKKIRGKYTYF